MSNQLPVISCACCHATSLAVPPHGDGTPCPSALELHAAEVADRLMHTQLLEAQRDATRAVPARRPSR